MSPFLTVLALTLAQQQPPPAPEKPAEPLFKSIIKQVSIGGQARFRAEYRDPVAYTNTVASREDDDFLLSRIRLNFGFLVTDDINLFIQPQDQRAFGDEGTVLTDLKNLDIHQGFVELKNLLEEPVTLKIGRQELSYGDQRLISPLDWSNIGRAWDGLKVRYTGSGWWADAFYTVIKEGTGAEDDQDFWGFYFSSAPFESHELDAYLFGREFNDNAFTGEDGAVGDLRDVTAGVRFKGKTGSFDYTAEGIFQTGKYSDDDIRAWGFAGTFGYTFDMDWKPRVGLEFTHASGDDDPLDGDRGTFDPLFPFQHFYQGFADQVGWRNSQDLALYIKVAPTDVLSLHLDLHNFWLVEDTDAWYSAAGTQIRRDTTGSSDERLGNEIDLHARYAMNKFVKFWGGASYFFTGPYVEDTPGSDRNMLWVFLQMMIDF